MTSARSMVPKRSSARARPATEPGMATDFGPKLLASSTTWRHGKSACAMPSASSKQPSWQAAGACTLKSSATVSPRRARCTSMVPPPATDDMNGSTTVIAKAVATAASTALPPRARIPAPTSAPSGCSAATRARAVDGVCLVTERVERIMRASPSRTRTGGAGTSTSRRRHPRGAELLGLPLGRRVGLRGHVEGRGGHERVDVVQIRQRRHVGGFAPVVQERQHRRLLRHRQVLHLVDHGALRDAAAGEEGAEVAEGHLPAVEPGREGVVLRRGQEEVGRRGGLLERGTGDRVESASAGSGGDRAVPDQGGARSRLDPRQRGTRHGRREDAQV